MSMRATTTTSAGREMTEHGTSAFADEAIPYAEVNGLMG